jgi:hypothetical protein
MGNYFMLNEEMKIMDVTSVSGASSNLNQSQIHTAVQTKMLNNIMNDQNQAAQQLIQALPQSQTVLNPSYLGRNVDIRA